MHSASEYSCRTCTGATAAEAAAPGTEGDAAFAGTSDSSERATAACAEKAASMSTSERARMTGRSLHQRDAIYREPTPARRAARLKFERSSPDWRAASETLPPARR